MCVWTGPCPAPRWGCRRCVRRSPAASRSTSVTQRSVRTSIALGGDINTESCANGQYRSQLLHLGSTKFQIPKFAMHYHGINHVISFIQELRISNLYHLSVHCPLSSPVQGCIRSSSPCHGKCSPGEAGGGPVACGDECIPQYLGKCFAPNHGDQHTVV